LIRLGLRLTLAGGREAVIRLVLMAAAVALGVAMLLSALAAINALNAQSLRTVWLTSRPGQAAPAPGAEPAWWLFTYDAFGNQVIDRVDVAATGPRSPEPPGIPRLPGPGQYYASPPMAALLRSTPGDELGDRYPGRLAGIIGDTALPSPGSLIIIVGRSPAQLAREGAVEITSIETGAGNRSIASIGTGPGESPAAIAAVLGIVALALLFPVLVFIATATRFAAARREQRFAAMRLAGASARQISVVAAVEAVTGAGAGTAGSFGIFLLIKPELARIPFSGQPFFPRDLSLGLAAIVVVALGVPAAAAVVAWVSLRRVRISPLGVSRRTARPRPGAWRVLPLLAGVGELVYFTAAGHPGSINGQLGAYLGGGALAVAGLVVAGPWLTTVGAALLARRAGGAAGLLAARRLADNPRAAFRAISGLILAVFVSTVAAAVITSMVSNHNAETGGAAGKSVLITDLNRAGDSSGFTAAPAWLTVPATLPGTLNGIRGVSDVVVTRADPSGTGDDALIPCAKLARLPGFGSCAAGASGNAVAVVDMSSVQYGGENAAAHRRALVWPVAAGPAGRLATLRATALLVATSGATSAIEQARTAIEVAFPSQAAPVTVFQTQGEQLLAAWQQMADVVIMASLPIAGCSLAVSVTAGLTDRRRPFSLLRLAGTPVALLRRVIALESAVPLVVVAVVSAGLGLAVAELFLRSQLGLNLLPPGPGYYAGVLGGLVLSLGIIAATFPLLSRITGPEAARGE
jgi:hypothetical protein